MSKESCGAAESAAGAALRMAWAELLLVSPFFNPHLSIYMTALPKYALQILV
ncbi:MAG: hypothetical protein NC331_00060 [Lachnospiraceae bacterium]|nr:hypothetical protein [Lachnospiraceae bacterium]MCM1237759.1 hypothetical protein [Lachnospiraceae bacterium]